MRSRPRTICWVTCSSSIDLAPIAGYAGTPPNLLIAIAPDGSFVGVRVLSHKEPIFNHGVAEESLTHFTGQYPGLSIKQSIKVAPSNGPPPPSNGGTAYIDGVSRATVSVRIMNETVLAAAMKVARAKLGMSAGKDPAQALRLKADDGTTADAAALKGKSFIARATIETAEVEKAFGAAFPKDVDGGAGSDPKAATTEIWAAYLSIPHVGRAVLGKAGFEQLMRGFRDGDHAILLASRGRYSYRGPEQRAGAVPDQVSLSQGGLPITVSDAIAVHPVETDALPAGVTWTVLKVINEAGFDPAQPWQLAMRISRKNAEIYPRRESKEFPLTLTAPSEFFEAPPVPLDGWHAVWHEQRYKIALAALMLLGLSAALAMPKRLTADAGAFGVFRLAYLGMTLAGIGWWGQGQLSIHNILAVINAATETGDFGFLLYDPVSLLLWAFVIGSLVIFGRGTFCGWLCPFGALQEFSAKVAGWLGIKQIKVPYALDRKLRLVKYAVLGAIITAAFVSTPLADLFAEIEPFKTAITLGFDRAWPYVLFAGSIVVLSAFVFKGFCLYVCPLGAALALLGRARLTDWIPRRIECGTPCQLCNVKCRYGAIEPKGEIRYDECFQCMDCVAIYHDSATCVPEVLARKKKGSAQAASRPVPALIAEVERVS